MMPGTDLMQNEWQAHGTCGWASADRYFPDIQRVYVALRRPTTAQMVPGGASAGPNQLLDTRVADVKQAFLTINPNCDKSTCGCIWISQSAQGDLDLPGYRFEAYRLSWRAKG
ncbi:hypothetical protein RBH89_11015 [Paracidovorax avenae]